MASCAVNDEHVYKYKTMQTIKLIGYVLNICAYTCLSNKALIINHEHTQS